MAGYKKLLIVVGVVAVTIAAYATYRFVDTWSRIPEAYAAWDTGTLLVEYMSSHDNRWPTGWDDLVTVLNDEVGNGIKLRGSGPERVEYANSLRRLVKVDWSFDPAGTNIRSPVTRPDGSAFPIVWEGAEPNETIREYLADRAGSAPASGR